MVLRGTALIGILTVILKSISVQPLPVTSEKAVEPSELTYEDNEEFKREIREKLEDLEKNNGKLFDRILLVNDIHKRWKSKDQLAKRNLDSNNIINVNSAEDKLKFEGDIVLDNEQKLEIENTESYRRKRNAVHQRKRIWPTREIPYYLDRTVLSAEAIDVIHKAIAIIHEKTCVRWVERTSLAQKHYVHFKTNDGCSSAIGRAYYSTEGQSLSLGEGCLYVSTALHEMTHAMGFYHEQSRNDRKWHIKIIWENIPEEFKDQFLEYSHGTIDKMNKDYDLNSLMHYSATAFGNGTTTIVPIDPSKSVGDAETFSPLDIVEINALYDCQTEDCKDNDENCAGWAKLGECTKDNAVWMEANCKKSCKACNCKDTNENCAGWAKLGECTKNAVWMEVNCKKSCTACSERLSSWSAWSECDDSCYKERQRFCFSRKIEDCPNTNVYGIESERVKCSSLECPAPIDGNWAMWSTWTSCSTTCDEGTRQRSRQCNWPAPQNGGRTCVGESNDASTCIKRRCKLGMYDVVFEEGWGIWSSVDKTFLIPWTQQSAGTKTMNTGPQGDHTLQGGGKFVYVESSNRAKGDMARLESRTLQFSTSQCLSFYYSMYGSLTGSLTLWMVPEGKAWFKLFTKAGNQGQDWLNADVTLDYMGKYKLVFEVIVGGRGYSDTALDDIFINNGACPGYVECNDNQPQDCPWWAKIGDCYKNSGYMHKDCKESCGLCSKSPPDRCEDVNSNCWGWAANGECEKNSGFMHINCTASCDICRAPCQDDNSECANWADDNQCTANPNWMGINCKKSCGKC